MKTLKILMATLTLILSALLVVSTFSAPANAGKDTTWGTRTASTNAKDTTWGTRTGDPVKRKAVLTDVTHSRNDSGYTADIHIVCTNGNHRYLGLGESSFGTAGKSCGQGGVERIVVGYNQTVYCENYLPPYQNKYYYTGNYNEVPSYASLECYMQRPL
jgi:hypothetical protein